MKFFHPGVQLVLRRVLLNGPEVRYHPYKILKVHLLLVIVLALVEESMDNPVPQGVDGQLGDPEEVLPTQVAVALLIQAGEPDILNKQHQLTPRAIIRIFKSTASDNIIK